MLIHNQLTLGLLRLENFLYVIKKNIGELMIYAHNLRKQEMCTHNAQFSGCPEEG